MFQIDLLQKELKRVDTFTKSISKSDHRVKRDLLRMLNDLDENEPLDRLKTYNTSDYTKKPSEST